MYDKTVTTDVMTELKIEYLNVWLWCVYVHTYLSTWHQTLHGIVICSYVCSYVPECFASRRESAILLTSSTRSSEASTSCTKSANLFWRISTCSRSLPSSSLAATTSFSLIQASTSSHSLQTYSVHANQGFIER